MFGRIFEYRLRRQYIVIAACMALACGLFVARITVLADMRWIWFLLPLAAISLRRHNIITLLAVSVVAFGIGWWRGSVYEQKLAVNDWLFDQKITLVGQASDDAVYGKKYQLEFTLNNAHVIAPVRADIVGGLTVRGFGEPVVYRGDTVQVSGKLRPALGNNVGSVSFANLQVLRRDNSWVNDLRRRFAAGMQSALPEPLASFSLGLLIGQRSTLPDDVNDQLRAVGLTHIIAVSGYNLTVIVMACRKLFANRSKFQATASCLALMALFLLMTGFSPPIVRASVISVLGLWAWYYGRELQAFVLLMVGGAITVIANPLYLWGNISWYLSFLSFFGVLIIGPLLTRRIYKAREPGLLGSIVVETLCASVMVIPYVLYVFGQTSLVSLPANVLVVPLIPIAMVLGMVAGLSGMLVASLAGWLAWPAVLLMTYMLDVAALLAGVPHAFVENIGFSWQAMVVAYATIGVVLIILRNNIPNLSKGGKLPQAEKPYEPYV